MTEAEKEILATLLHLEETVRQMKTASPKPNLLPIFSKLDDLTRQLPKNTNPELLHVLHKKSYEKARMILQSCEPEKGSCAHSF